MDFDSNPYETDDEREQRLREAFERAKATQAMRQIGVVDQALGKTGSKYRVSDEIEKEDPFVTEEIARMRAEREPPPNPYEKEEPARSAKEAPPNAGTARTREDEVAYYLRHTGKDVDDRDATTREYSQRDFIADKSPETAHGYTDERGTWVDGKLEGKAQRDAGTVNQALEKTGSNYRIEAEPQPEPVSRQPFNPRASTKQLRQESLDMQNEALSTLSGQEDRLRSVGDTRDGLLEQKGEATSQHAGAMRERFAAAQAERAQFEAQADARLARMAQLVDNPPEEVWDAGRAIMGAIFSVGSNGRVSDGREQMARATAANVAKWKSEIQGNEELMNEFRERAKYSTGKALDDEKLDSMLMDMHFASLDVVMQRAQAQAETAEKADKIGMARADLKQGFVNKELHQRELQAAAANKGNRAEREAAILAKLASLPLEQRSDAAMAMGADAVELWKKAQHNISTDVDMAKKAADAEKALREETAGGQKMTDGDKKLQRLAEGVRPAYNTLAKRAERIAGGDADAGVPYVGVGPGATKLFAGEEVQNLNTDIQQLANVLLRDESGASIPEAEQKIKWDSWGILSPDEAVRNRGLAKMLAEYEGRVAHVAPVTGAPSGGGGGAQPSSGTSVRMRSPKGRSVAIPAEQVEAAKANGYKLEQTAGTGGGW